MIIIYNNNGIKLLHSAIQGVDLKIIGEKDVPAGIPFIIVSPNELPTEPQETWEVDFSEPDGYGLSKDEFISKYPHHSNWGVNE